MSFEIKLPLFEGPFDLLLFFIERNELDIHDIPIAQITTEFLNYLHHLERFNIELASDFMLVAATLMRIKAKMLLPRPPEEEGEDPRQELVNYLLEYKKYKSVLGKLSELEAQEMAKTPRGNLQQELENIATENAFELELSRLDLYKLLKVYEQVIARAEIAKNAPKHTIIPYPYTVSGQKTHLLERLKHSAQKRLSFSEIISESKDKVAVIFNFLAILELLQNRLINLQLDEGFNNFYITQLIEAKDV